MSVPQAPLRGLSVEQLRRLGAELQARRSAPSATLSLASALEAVGLDEATLAHHAQRWGGIAEVEDVYGLSPLQVGMLAATLEAPEHSHYHDQLVCRLRAQGGLREASFGRALAALVERHPALRTVFAWDLADRPLQVVLRRGSVVLNRADWRGESAAAQRQRLSELLREDRDKPFELDRLPLLRLHWIHLDEQSAWLVVSLHHILLDAWSEAVMLGELRELYASAEQNRLSALPPAPPFGAFLRWLGTQDLAASLELWRQELADGAEPTLLPYDREPTSASVSPQPSEDRSLALSPQLIAALHELARRERLTPSLLLEAGWALALARATGRERVLFGTVVAGRPSELAGAEAMVGLFANTLPWPVALPPTRTLEGWFQDLQGLRMRRSRYPWLSPRDLDGARAAQLGSVVVVVNTPEAPSGTSRVDESTLEIEPEVFAPRTDLPLTLMAWPRSSFLLRLFFDRRAFDPTTVERLLRQLRHFLEELASGPTARPLSALPTLDAVARQQLLYEWNDTALATERNAPTVLTAFAERCLRQPDAIVAVDAEEQLSFAELARRSQAGARRLLQLGFEPAAVIAVLAPRGNALLGAMVAVFETGGTYLPLEPQYPETRLAELLQRSGAVVLVAAASLWQDAVAAVNRLALEGRPEMLALEALLAPSAPGERALPLRPATAEDLAYVLYTSGSTGAPKGALVEHRGMFNHLLAKREDLALDESSVVAQTASQCFDISIWQFLVALVVGGRVVIFADELVREPTALARSCQRLGVTVLEVVPSVLQALLDSRPSPHDELGLEGLRWFVPTGEALPPQLAQRWFAACPLVPMVNAYGPTECSDDVSHHRIDALDLDGALPPRMLIGRPVVNLALYVVGPRLELLPIRSVGELVVGGVGVGRGYLGDARRTADAFRPDPYGGQPGARLYRTGDVARHDSQGRLDFLGRRDHQVKVRGLRIELSEIELALERSPAVASAVVVAQGDASSSDRRLVAFVVAAQQPADPDLSASLRSALFEALPPHLVPSAIVILEQLPLTANGKVDRKALAALPVTGADASHRRPRTPTEEILLGVWSEVLGQPDLDPDSSFFDHGGHSLSAIRVLARLRSAFGIELSLRTFLEHPRLSELAAQIESSRRGSAGDATLRLEPRGNVTHLPLSFAQQRLWILQQVEAQGATYNIPAAIELQRALQPQAFRAALTEVVRRHEVLRTTYEWSGDEPEQRIHPNTVFPLPWVDLGALAEPDRELVGERLTSHEARRAFALDRDPPLRACLLRFGPGTERLLLTLHHIASDHGSLAVLVEELAVLYEAACEGAELAGALPPLPLQYADFALWQRARLTPSALAPLLAFWRAQLQPSPPPLALPFDHPEPELPSFAGTSLEIHLAPPLLDRLQQLSRSHGVTLFMTLLGVFATLLRQLCGQTDLLVGTDWAGRSEQATERLIGFFINLLPLRIDAKGNPTFLELLTRVRETVLAAYEHQELPFDRLVSELQLERSGGRTPLIEALFVFQNPPVDPRKLSSLGFEVLHRDTGVARFPLALFLDATPSGLVGRWTFQTQRFERATIELWHRRFSQLLEQLASSPEARLDELGRPTPGPQETSSGGTHRVRALAKLHRHRPNPEGSVPHLDQPGSPQLRPSGGDG